MNNSKIMLEIDTNGVIRGELPQSVTVNHQGPLVITIQSHAHVSLDILMHAPIDIQYILEPFAEAELFETRNFISAGSYRRETILQPYSRLRSVMLNQSDYCQKLSAKEIFHVMKDAQLEVSYGELSAHHVEAVYQCELDEEGAKAHLCLAGITRHDDRKHYEVILNHHALHTYGLMENYGVTRDRSCLLFDGVGRIDQGMHQSESHQTSRIIVFEPQCTAKANPYLYIDDYDVKASHAASVGAINEEHLYYLESRGLTRKQAMHLVTMGYLLPAFKIIQDEEMLSKIETLLLKKVGEV